MLIQLLIQLAVNSNPTFPDQHSLYSHCILKTRLISLSGSVSPADSRRHVVLACPAAEMGHGRTALPWLVFPSLPLRNESTLFFMT